MTTAVIAAQIAAMTAAPRIPVAERAGQVAET